MARTLNQRLVSELGRRKVAKYFPDDQEDGTGDQEILDELVAEGLRELGETIPIDVGEDLVVADSQIDVSPMGRTAARRLAVRELWYDGSSDGIPRRIPVAIPGFADGIPITTAGWTVNNQTILLRGVSYTDGTSLRVMFAVAPLESEISDSPNLMRAASLFAAAEGMERIAEVAQREHTVRIDGVPDVRDTVAQCLTNCRRLRQRARNILGIHVAVI